MIEKKKAKRLSKKDLKKPKGKKLAPGKGRLIIVGGAEDKENEKTILKKIAECTGDGKLVIMTLASSIAQEVWLTYKKIFTELGVKSLVHFYIESHQEALDPKNIALFEGASAVFMSGGDQLKITTKLGGSPISDLLLELYKKGGTIAGTSAGASVMGRLMLVGSENAETHKVGNWMMAPGLGFIKNIIIDQHFAQRGRIGRLLSAVGLNPGVLGIGIDEDTAIMVEQDKFKVIGSNAVYVIDGRDVTDSNISEATANKTMSMHNIRLHIMCEGEIFDFKNRVVYTKKIKKVFHD